MKYKQYKMALEDALRQYKDNVDKQEKAFEKRGENLNKQYKSMVASGNYTQKYLDEWKENNKPESKDIIKIIDNERTKTKAIVDYNLEKISKELDSYFNAPVSQNFSNKIQSIALLGVQLSDAEFDLLKDSANSYMEMRLLNQLAESRTKTVKDNKINLDNASTDLTPIEKNAPYIGIELPNVSLIYGSFNSYKSSVNNFLNYYNGANNGLRVVMDKSVPIYVYINADSFYRNKHSQDLTNVLEQANSVLPSSKIKRTLTDKDKAYIDAIVQEDEKYPSLTKERILKLAENEELKDLLLLDSRYNQLIMDAE